ncbi:hypothetical protein VST7929_03306 [Vibrio stylophorae]|uniref:Uncharacterized protein n=1 Tax=Vibrio stylophorae TaxID=659351 RepID=A0ABN8E0S9_9VIBR|nr:hypothetical protein [Vibrio stylophorae]CAH0536288.1 hypothetical protein VST7929_03306 [Vibrio stylophorae]
MEELAHAAQLEPWPSPGYLGCLIILLIAYPFCIVALAILADGERQRMRWQSTLTGFI